MGQKKSVELIYNGVVLSKKNSKRIIRNPRTGKPLVISNPSAKKNEDSMVKAFKKQSEYLELPLKKCWVKVNIFEPNWTRRDLDNQVTSILDALVKAEVLKDDGIKNVVGIKVSFGGVDATNPRAEITLTEI